MVSEVVTVTNSEGLHLRPAGTVGNVAIRYQSKIMFEVGTYHGNLKSVLSILAGGVKKGDEIRIICEGPDEEEALQAMISVFDNGFDSANF